MIPRPAPNQVQLALIGVDIGAVAVPFLVDPSHREVSLDQVRRPPPALTGSSGACAPTFRPGGQAHLGHHRRDRVLADPSARIMQARGDYRRPALALVPGEQPGDLGFEPLPARPPR